MYAQNHILNKGNNFSERHLQVENFPNLWE